MADPKEAIEEHDDLDAEQIAEDIGDLLGAKETPSPASEADAPPPG